MKKPPTWWKLAFFVAALASSLGFGALGQLRRRCPSFPQPKQRTRLMKLRPGALCPHGPAFELKGARR